MNDICEKKSSNISANSLENKEGEFKIYGASGHIKNINFYQEDKEYIAIIKDGAGVGKTMFCEAKSSVLGTLDKIKVLNDNSLKFLYYLLKTINFSKYIIGSTIPHIYFKDYSKEKIKTPQKGEQHKIACFFDKINLRIETQNKIIEDYKLFKKGVMHKIFNQKNRFKDEEGSFYSQWQEEKLGVLTNKAGKKNKENINYPIYSINNKEGFLPQSDQFEGMNSNSRGYDISLYKIIQKNTFAYNPARINVGSIGFSGDLENIIISSLYVCFKTTEELDDNYLLQYLDSFEFNKSVLRSVEGGVREYLFYENFSAIKIPLPCIEEQQKIALTLTAIDDKIKLEATYLEKLNSQKQYLLQNLFI